MMRRLATLLWVLFFGGVAFAAETSVRLDGFARLPADTRAAPPRGAPDALRWSGKWVDGPGSRLDPAKPVTRNGHRLPLRGQPVQGISAAAAINEAEIWALSDNGLGGKRNSSDMMLAIHRLRLDWQTQSVRRTKTLFLSDPNRVLAFPIAMEADPSRWLTGADLDPESLQPRAGGGFWIGDEFGPYLIEVDDEGRVIALHETKSEGRDVRSPDHFALDVPDPGGASRANLRRSRGFEGLALSGDGAMLYALLEGPIAADGKAESAGGKTALRMLEFDVAKRAWTGRFWLYPLEDERHAIGDVASIGDGAFLILEPDGGQGGLDQACPKGQKGADCFPEPARFKRVYRAEAGKDGVLIKRAHVDLLDVPDPDGRSGRSAAGRYSMPFVTIETALPMEAGRLLVINDNNFPLSAGRTPGAADETEFAMIAAPGLFSPARASAVRPIVIAHRGASGERPEHTLLAYERAIDQGADYIEPDLVMTKDGVLVARHENEISETTNVAAVPAFAGRRATKTVDGETVSGWFTEDFTLAELKTLRARERLPQVRPQNVTFDGRAEIPTLQEIIDLVRRKEAETGRRIGLYPETKHPSYFAALGLPMEAALVKTLAANGFDERDDLVFIQSFETQNLRRLRTMTRLRLVQLIAKAGRPWDFTAAKDARTYRDLLSDGGLTDIAAYADGIGVEKSLAIGPQPLERLVPRAHAAGLIVHLWTFRNENMFLPQELRLGEANDPRFLALPGDAAAEYARAFALGVDGVFSDFPAAALAVRDR
jgi:glycerophosphoryl diester phosphodiesterase